MTPLAVLLLVIICTGTISSKDLESTIRLPKMLSPKIALLQEQGLQFHRAPQAT